VEVRFQVLLECLGGAEEEVPRDVESPPFGRARQRNQTVHLAVPGAYVTLCCKATSGLTAVAEGQLANDGVPWCWVCRLTGGT
jgi:hypothetical protein